MHQGFPPWLPVGSQIPLISLPAGIFVMTLFLLCFFISAKSFVPDGSESAEVC